MRTVIEKILASLSCVLMCCAIYAEDYYIQGTLEGSFVNGKYVTKLHNPIGNGIDFFYEPEVIGEAAEKGQYSFRFKNATTNCPDGFAKGLSFYKKENNTWQKDSEVSSGVAQFRSDHTMVIVLVLDYSNSLGEDYLKVQESAIEFVNLLSEKTGNRGNVHIGIVAFNYKNTILDIIPLTDVNLNRIKSFIRSLTIDNNTALYGAIDQGIIMLEDYVMLNNLNNFDGAALVTFTDGLDNASLKAEKNISSPSKYLEYLKPIVTSKYIKNKKLDSYIVAVKGKDVKEHETTIFSENLKSLTTSINNYYQAENMTSLKQEFLSIADGLVKRWMDLVCYIPPTGQGEVRWVLECGSKPAPIIVEKTAIRKKVISEIGVVGGGINGFSSKFINGKFAYQLDLGLKFFTFTDYLYYNLSYEYLAYVLDLSQNFMFQDNVRKWQNGTLSWFLGGGINIGYELYYLDALKLGANGMIGLEYMFNKTPIALQLDFRPGYARIMKWTYYWDSNTNSYINKTQRNNLFEWTIGLGIRYYL